MVYRESMLKENTIKILEKSLCIHIIVLNGCIKILSQLLCKTQDGYHGIVRQITKYVTWFMMINNITNIIWANMNAAGTEVVNKVCDDVVNFEYVLWAVNLQYWR